MATLDEIAKCEDELATVLVEYRDFQRDSRHWSFRHERDGGPFTKKAADLSPAYFGELDDHRRKVERAEAMLRHAKAEWLRGLL